MRRTRPVLLLLPLVSLATAATLAACTGGGAVTTDEQTYTVDGAVTALVFDARAAGITVEAGTGPVTVTESYKYAGDRPATTHAVAGGTLTLTETGCDDDVRCEVRYRIVLPASASTQITARAGAVKLTGLAGDVTVQTEAGAVEGTALTGDRVTVSTRAGATTLAFADAPALVKASTEVGAVELKVPGDAAYALKIDTAVGKADVTVPRDDGSEHRIEVTTQVGAVNIAPAAS